MTEAKTSEIQRFDNCTLVPVEWAQGDQFRIRLPDGTEQTLRLYGIDCFELASEDESSQRKLREQRRYFGITENGTVEESVALASDLGRQAVAVVRELLSKPFTVYTTPAKGEGDGRFPRVYGFVVTADGEDLAMVLVSMGLARAHGVARSTPFGLKREEYREELKNAELVAARRGIGAWAYTNWDRLPAERRILRDEQNRILSAIRGTLTAEQMAEYSEIPPQERGGLK